MPRAPALVAGQTHSAPTGLLAYGSRAFRQVSRSWKRRRQLAHVAHLDDHLLADIGLTRDEVNTALPLAVSKLPTA